MLRRLELLRQRHPAARSFLSFAKRYCDAYRNDYGWVTTGASNLEELNLLMKEVSIRRRKEEVLDLPPKIRSFVPVDISGSKAAFGAVEGFLEWFAASDPARPNDTEFLARLTKVRVALHKAKQKAVEERVRDVVAGGEKVVVFTCFAEGIARHKATLGESAVTITGSDTAEERMRAVDRFQSEAGVRVALCNIIAGGVDIDQGLLAFAPGGVTEMGLIALAIEADAAFVAVHHILRILIVLVLARPLLALVARRAPKRPSD